LTSLAKSHELIPRRSCFQVANPFAFQEFFHLAKPNNGISIRHMPTPHEFSSKPRNFERSILPTRAAAQPINEMKIAMSHCLTKTCGHWFKPAQSNRCVA
jgi:hypothetical protein